MLGICSDWPRIRRQLSNAPLSCIWPELFVWSPEVISDSDLLPSWWMEKPPCRRKRSYYALVQIHLTGAFSLRPRAREEGRRCRGLGVGTGMAPAPGRDETPPELQVAPA